MYVVMFGPKLALEISRSKAPGDVETKVDDSRVEFVAPPETLLSSFRRAPSTKVIRQRPHLSLRDYQRFGFGMEWGQG